MLSMHFYRYSVAIIIDEEKNNPQVRSTWILLVEKLYGYCNWYSEINPEWSSDGKASAVQLDRALLISSSVVIIFALINTCDWLAFASSKGSIADTMNLNKYFYT